MASVGPGPVLQSREVPGDPVKVTTAILEKSSEFLQSFKPISRIHAHLCAFHFYAYDMRRQVEAHHYCTHYNEDMHQCLIYDSPTKDARLIGIEYIVSESVFLSLPDEEKKLWHSHEYEVKSGILFMPHLPEVAELPLMKEYVKTYGKVFHFWQYDRGDTLPLGPPQLMMAFTSDGQLNDQLLEGVERRMNISIAEMQERRADLEGPENGIHPLANSCLSGKGLVSEMEERDLPDRKK